jgi:transposase
VVSSKIVVDEKEETIMSKRRKFSGREKLEIVLEGMQSERGIAEVCRRHGISSTLYYRWRDQLLGNADQVFTDKKMKPNRREAELEQEVERLRDVIAEITAENVAFKKNTWSKY